MKSYLSTSKILALAIFSLITLYWSQTSLRPGQENIEVKFPTELDYPDTINPQSPFEDLRHRYLTLVAEANEYSVPHPPIRKGKRNWQDRVDHIHANALHHYVTLNKNENRQSLWVDIADYTSSNVTATFYRMGSLAQAWITPGGPLYHNNELLDDMMVAVRWLADEHYYPEMLPTGNWWDWQIGIPYQINDLVVIFYEVMDEQLRKRLLHTSRRFIPEPVKTGANRVWTSKIVTVRGILDNNATELTLGSERLVANGTGVLEFVEEGDGFYHDGSFIQHENIPYHGGYGKNLFKGMVDIIYLLHGSTWEIKDERVNHIYDWAVKSFMTTIWRGSLFANLRGREISRLDGTDYRAADDVISAVIRLIQISPNEKLVVKFKRWVKHNIVSARPFHDYLDTAPGSLYRAATEIINDESLKEPKDVNQIVWMKNADRAFMLRPGYAFTLSMSSERVATYECLNGGNLKGWYTGAGMTLLYNADLGQYSDGYWATADMYHVPGTTASLNERKPCSGSRKVSPDRWTCGANSGGYASIGMSYQSWDMNANAVKSWFFLDNEIVCLGANISGQGLVQTTIEQRRIFSQKQISVDGTMTRKDNTWTQELDVNIPHTVRLENNVEDAEDIEYYIEPSNDPVIVSKVDQTGSWIDVNNGHVIQDTTPFTRKYANIIIDHGDSPINASYAYSIRPQPSASTFKQVASYKILANTATVQAVQSSNLKVTGAIFFGKDLISGVVSANASCAVTIEQNSSKTEAKVAIELAKPDQPVQVDVMNFPYHYVLNEVPGITVDTKAVAHGLRLTISVPSTVLAFIR